MKQIILIISVCLILLGILTIAQTYCSPTTIEIPNVTTISPKNVEVSNDWNKTDINLISNFIPNVSNNFSTDSTTEVNEEYRFPEINISTDDIKPSDETTIFEKDSNIQDKTSNEKAIDNYTLKRNFAYYDGTLSMMDITDITFTNVAPENYDEKWFANITNTDDIIGYRCGTSVYVVGEKIYFNPSSKYMFAAQNTYGEYLWKSLKTIIGLEFVNTSLVTNMSRMFYGNQNIVELNLNSWDVSNVSDMSLMFAHCFNLEKLYVDQWDVSNVWSFKAMFQGSNHAGNMKLSFIDVSNWNTSGAVDMGHMFYGCGNLQHINVSNWNVENVTSFTHMFADCFLLQELDISNWKTHSVVTFDAFLNDCRSLKMFDVSMLITTTCIQFSQMFESCVNLEVIIGIEDLDVSNASEFAFSEMFHNCVSLKQLDLTNWNTSKADNFARMFANCKSLTYLDLSNFDISSLQTVLEMFTGVNPDLEIVGIENWNLCEIEGNNNMY